MKVLVIALLIAGCSGCRFSLKDLIGHDAHDLHIGDMVVPPRSAYDKQLPGTKLFARTPLTAIIDSAGQRIIKNKQSYIDYYYDPGRDFAEKSSGIIREMDSVTRLLPASVYYTRDFHMGSCRAILYYTKSRLPGKDQFILYFGDKHFTASASAQFSPDDTEDRDILLKTLLSFYLDEDATEDISSRLPYTLDLSHSDFLYCTHTYYGFFYTVHGKGRPEAQLNRDQFMITFLNNTRGRSDSAGHPITLEDRSADLLGMIKNTGVHIVQSGERKTVVGGEPAWEGNGYMALGDSVGMFYTLATGDPHHPLCLISLLYHDPVRRLAQVRGIARSLRLKEYKN